MNLYLTLWRHSTEGGIMKRMDNYIYSEKSPFQSLLAITNGVEQITGFDIRFILEERIAELSNEKIDNLKRINISTLDTHKGSYLLEAVTPSYVAYFLQKRYIHITIEGPQQKKPYDFIKFSELFDLDIDYPTLTAICALQQGEYVQYINQIFVKP